MNAPHNGRIPVPVSWASEYPDGSSETGPNAKAKQRGSMWAFGESSSTSLASWRRMN